MVAAAHSVPHSGNDGSGAMRERLTGLEKSVGEVREDFKSLRADVDTQFVTGRRETGEQLSNFREDIARQISAFSQEVRDSRIKGTNWGWVGSWAAVAIVLAGAVLAPLYSSLSDAKVSFRDIEETFKHFEQFYARRDDMKDDFAKLDELIQKNVTRKEHDEFAKRLDQRDSDERVEYFREIDRVDRHVNQVDSDQIKRPEIQALFDNMRARIDALSARQESTDRLIGSTYNFGDTIKSLQASVEGLQSKLFALYAQPQAVPIIPIPKN